MFIIFSIIKVQNYKYRGKKANNLLNLYVVMKILKYILLPIAWIYAFVVWIRHSMFDAGTLKSRKFAIPTICVGNITVGGTGKTPFVEYLIRLLQSGRKLAVVSRGYKRKSKGMQVSDENATAEILGDEPYQIFRKYPKTLVVADSNRCRAIDYIEANHANVDAVILDDAFQHRYVNAGLNILLIDYNRPVSKDCMLPAGRLRDLKSAQKRANIIVVTKCPKDLKPIDFNNLTKEIKPLPYQDLFFATLDYDTPYHCLTGEKVELTSEDSLVLFTGIAKPQPLEDYLSANVKELKSIKYSDHHNYSDGDNEKIYSEFTKLNSDKKWIITTEKDAAKLSDFSDKIKERLIIIPVRVKILNEEDSVLSKKIRDYVEKNRRNSQLS
jgi:tetraacyldisaccharide 4'-kinase